MDSSVIGKPSSFTAVGLMRFALEFTENLLEKENFADFLQNSFKIWSKLSITEDRKFSQSIWRHVV